MLSNALLHQVLLTSCMATLCKDQVSSWIDKNRGKNLLPAWCLNAYVLFSSPQNTFPFLLLEPQKCYCIQLWVALSLICSCKAAVHPKSLKQAGIGFFLPNSRAKCSPINARQDIFRQDSETHLGKEFPYMLWTNTFQPALWSASSFTNFYI